jgi:hypothetical protein
MQNILNKNSIKRFIRRSKDEIVFPRSDYPGYCGHVGRKNGATVKCQVERERAGGHRNLHSIILTLYECAWNPDKTPDLHKRPRVESGGGVEGGVVKNTPAPPPPNATSSFTEG